MSASGPVAAIDLGTNTALLLVARRTDAGGFEVLHQESVTARLGQGLARTGRLDDGAIERALDALAGFLAHAAELGVAPGRVRAVGTAVLRRAADAPRFLTLARERLQLEVEVISGEEEARLGFAAVADGARSTVVVDAGGASTEVVAEGGETRVSAPIGALVLTERFLGLEGREALEPGGWPALLDVVREESAAFPAGAAREQAAVLIGGTAVNLACLELASGGLERFDPARAEGLECAASAPAAWAVRLLALEPAERRALPIEADRAELLPAGLACLAGALERLEARAARISTRGLRHAVARELLGSS